MSQLRCVSHKFPLHRLPITGSDLTQRKSLSRMRGKQFRRGPPIALRDKLRPEPTASLPRPNSKVTQCGKAAMSCRIVDSLELCWLNLKWRTDVLQRGLLHSRSLLRTRTAPKATPMNNRGVRVACVASEVKSHSLIDRFLVVFHSPTGRAGNRTATLPIRENGRCATYSGLLVLSLQCGSNREKRELAGISLGFQGITRGSLCTSDCAAERVGFETIVQRSFM